MFNLTRDERRLLGFVAAMALIGLGSNFLLKRCSHIKVLSCFSADIGRINLNQADEELLMTVPGIGPVLARRILDYRLRQEGFKDRSQLREIKGISGSKYEKIKDAFMVDGGG